MSLTNPAFFASDRLPRWRKAARGAAIWARLRFRHNPGFVTAAVAGTAGLILAMVLILSNGFNLLEDPEAKNEEPALATQLGDATDDPADTPATTVSTSRTPSPRKGGDPHDRDPFADDDKDVTDDDSIVAVTKPGTIRTSAPPTKTHHLSAVEEPDAGDDEQEVEGIARTAISGSRLSRVDDTDSEDETRDDAVMGDDEPLVATTDDEVAEDNSIRKATPPRLKSAPLLADDPVEESDDDSAEPVEDLLSRSPPARKVETPVASHDEEASDRDADDDDERLVHEPAVPAPARAGWKNTAPRSGRTPETPAAGTREESPAVETAVFAAPETTAPREIEPPARRPEPAPASSLVLDMKVPPHLMAGQTVDLEFRVTNRGKATVRNALLSVALPAGLSHPLGPEVEQAIASLAPGQTHRGRLRVRAEATGSYTVKADIALGRETLTRAAAPLRVGTKSAAAPSADARVLR